MARVKIREFEAKKLLLKNLKQEYRGILVDSSTNLNVLAQQYPWILQEKLVVKPDQLFGKRGKLGLVLLDADFQSVKEYLQQNMGREFTIGKATDKLTHFLIEPFVPHQVEYYVSITSEREKNIIHFSEAGGIHIEENWRDVRKIEILTLDDIDKKELKEIYNDFARSFVKELYKIFVKQHFTYLEINPFAFDLDGKIILLDTVAQVDSCGITLPFPKPFGRKSYPE